jgi:hypothetical protein
MAQQLSIADVAGEVASVKDGTISDSASYAARGDSSLCFVGTVAAKGGASVYRSLLYMTVGERIPKGSLIKSAVLRLNCVQAGGSTLSLQQKFLAVDWTEDSSFPTWANRASGTAWGDSGASGSGDTFAGFGTKTLGALPSSTGDNDFDVTESVKYAVERNSGIWNILLLVDDEDGTPAELVKFRSGDDSTEDDRPELIIDYVQGGGSSAKARSSAMHASRSRSVINKNRNKYRT